MGRDQGTGYRFPATPNQLYHLREHAQPGHRDHHVLSRAWTFGSAPDPVRLRDAFAEVCQAHPMLRARFDPGESAFTIAADCPPTVSLADAAAASPGSVPVDPVAGTAAGLAVGDQTVRLAISHAVCDRRSFAQAVSDLGTAYAGRPVPAETAPYAEYAGWLDQRRRAALSDPALADQVLALRLAAWPLAAARRPAPPARFSHWLRYGRSPVAVQAGSRAAGMTVTGALLDAAGTALRAQTGGQAAVIGLPVALRPGLRFRRTVGDYTNMALVVLAAPGRAGSEGTMRRLAAAIRLSPIHVLELSRLAGAPDIARTRVDVDGESGQPLALDGEPGSPVEEPGASTTRRDLSVELRMSGGQARLLCALRDGAPAVDLTGFGEQTACALHGYGF
jgi:hypothetical protein